MNKGEDTKILHSILIVISARIGDTILATPVISSLKRAFPDAVIDVIAHPKRFSLLENNLDIDNILLYDTFFKIRAIFKKAEPYDIAFFYSGSTALLKYVRSVSKKVIGFIKDKRHNHLLDIAVPASDVPIHAVDERLLLIKRIGVSDTDNGLKYCVTRSEREWAAECLKKMGIAKGTKVVGFQVAGFPTKPYRDWPERYFIELGIMILRDFDTHIVLIGSTKDHKKAVSIKKGISRNTHWTGGKITIRQSAALISMLDLFVTTDTGPMHIAFALGTATVALFHCMHKGQYLGPLKHIERHRIVQMDPPKGVKCSRKMTMDSVLPEQVYSCVMELMGNSA